MSQKNCLSSNTCEEELEKWVDNYTEFCSQIDRIDETQKLNATEALQSQPYAETELLESDAGLDFQSIFQQFLEKNNEPNERFDGDVVFSQVTQTAGSEQVNDIPIDNTQVGDTEAADNSNPMNPLLLQTGSMEDFNEFARTFIHTENISKKPTFEEYIGCGRFFETRKDSQSTSEASTVKPKPNNSVTMFKTGPLALFIRDICKINIAPKDDNAFGSGQQLYGRAFRQVMFYGRCDPGPIRYRKVDGSSEESVNRQYIVDDGTANIVIHITKAANENIEKFQLVVNSLMDELKLAHQHGLAFLGNDDYKANSRKCEEILKCSETLIEVIRRNIRGKNRILKKGSKVFVIGTPFRNSNTGHINVFVNDYYEDDNLDREMELWYMSYLNNTYIDKLLKFKITGEPNTIGHFTH